MADPACPCTHFEHLQPLARTFALRPGANWVSIGICGFGAVSIILGLGDQVLTVIINITTWGVSGPIVINMRTWGSGAYSTD